MLLPLGARAGRAGDGRGGRHNGGDAEHPLPSGGCWSCWGGCPPHAPVTWLRFSLLILVVLRPELPSSDHSCTELPWALWSGCRRWVAPAPLLAVGFFPLGSEQGVAASPKLPGPAPGAHLAAGVLLAEDEGAPKASLESGVRGKLQ